MNDCTIILKGFNRLFASWLQEKIRSEKKAFCEIWNEDERTQIVQPSKSNVIVLQHLRNRTELEKLEEMKVHFINAPIILWWGETDISETEIIRTLNLGVSAIISERQDWEDILNAIKDVRENGFHHNELITAALFQHCRRNRILKRDVPGPGNPFGERERRIIELRRSGKTSKEIGEILFLSKKTIDKSFGELYRRFECNNFFELLSTYESEAGNKIYST